MSHDIRKWIHRIYGIAVSAVTVVAGGRFILGCYSIYRAGKTAGGQIYSRAAVAQAFQPMALSVYLCLALVIAGFILHLVLPQAQKKALPKKNRQLILSRLRAKTDLEAADPDSYRTIARLQLSRKLHCGISTGLLLIFSLAFIGYACRSHRWPDVAQVTPVVVETVFAMLLCLLLPTGYTVFTAYHNRKSLDREIDLMRALSKQHPRQGDAPLPCPKRKSLICYIRYGILALALAMVIFGYVTGGIEDVVAKAAAICTECVGLG